jgi:hypothetical protein
MPGSSPRCIAMLRYGNNLIGSNNPNHAKFGISSSCWSAPRREREEGEWENSRRTPASSSLPSTAASPGSGRAISRSRVARRGRGAEAEGVEGRVGSGGGGRGAAESRRLRWSRRRLREAAAVGGRAGNGGGFGAGAARSKGREVGREEEGGDPPNQEINSKLFFYWPVLMHLEPSDLTLSSIMDRPVFAA